MYKFYSIVIFFCFLLGCTYKTGDRITAVVPDNSYPRWLKNTKYHTDQTSGITFIGTNKNNEKIFLLADDIGKIHHLKIKSDTIFSFSPVYLSSEVKAYLDTFPKWDFEEIVYDKFTKSSYLSIEGNGVHFKKFVGIYKIGFPGNNPFADSIVSISRLNITPQKEFLEYTAPNIGYEGLTNDKNNLYLGLEGFERNNLFADSTYIYIVNKKNLKIIKKVGTKNLGLATVCGLYSLGERELIGIDRNDKKIFYIKFDKNYNVVDSSTFQLESPIPEYHKFVYVASLEGITVDDNNNVYLVDDPWKTFFVPPKQVYDQLDAETQNNFNNFIPVIYKYKLKY